MRAEGRLLRKGAARLSVPHHLLAVRIEGVVDDPLRGIQFMVVLEAELAKPFGNGIEPRTLGLMIKRVVRVGAVDDPAEQDQRRIAGELVFLQDRLERAFLAMVTELDVRTS